MIPQPSFVQVYYRAATNALQDVAVLHIEARAAAMRVELSCQVVGMQHADSRRNVGLGQILQYLPKEDEWRRTVG